MIRLAVFASGGGTTARYILESVLTDHTPSQDFEAKMYNKLTIDVVNSQVQSIIYTILVQ